MLAGEVFDLIHVDGGHDLESVLADILNAGCERILVMAYELWHTSYGILVMAH